MSDYIEVGGRRLAVDVVEANGRMYLRLEWPGDEIGRPPSDEEWAAAQEAAYADIDDLSEGFSEEGYEYAPLQVFGWLVQSDLGDWWYISASDREEAIEKARALLADRGDNGTLYETYSVACGIPTHTPDCGHSVAVKEIEVG